MDDVIGNTQKKVLFEIVRCFERRHIQYAVIGAMALILNRVKLKRLTKDLDITLLVEAEKDFKKVISDCGFESAEVPHEYRLKGVAFDMIPLYKSEGSVDIYWPTGRSMSIIGFREAIKHARDVEIRFGNSSFKVKVAPIPVVIFLKIIACAERVESGDISHARKHLRDVVNCQEHYDEEIEITRRFDYQHVVEGVKDEFVCAGAFLAGHDLKELRSRDIEDVFEENLAKCCELRLGEKEKMLLDCFQRGFNYNGE